MSQYAKEIKHILATLNKHGDEHDAPLPDEEELDTIHVYPVEGGGILFTRTPLEPDESAPPIIDSRDDHTTGVPTTKSPPLFVLFLLLLCLFVVGDVADGQLMALMTPTAIIAITPEVRAITLQSTATLGKLLSPLTLTQSQTVPTTGHGHQDARAATGTLTFYNGEFQSVTVAAGTVVTGNDGEHIAITQEAIIPAADPTTNPPTFGHMTVAAQAVQVGASGNIQAFDVSGACCAASVLVKNLAPFAHGQDERDFMLVTQADRDTAAATLHAKVTTSMIAALQGQLLPGQELHTLPCSPATTATHAPGEEATSVTVSVSETCTAVAYDIQQLNTRAIQLLTTQATHTLGTGYLLYGSVQVTVSKATQTTPGVTLAFTCQGTYAYTLNGQAQQRIKTLLAGKPRLAALRLLLQQTGIHTASITGIPDNQPLPDDQTHLHLLIVLMLF
jgi:hypothetical protein